MRTPVLLIIFNRPNTTAEVLSAIRAARPERLYVAADGPRPSRHGEAEHCAETRRVATTVDWPCEVKTRFVEKNLGCRRAVSQAISWFFECEPEGIVLEDDCVPHSSFFPYCEVLLEKYRDDPRVMSIGGTNTCELVIAPDSFFFSKYVGVWGWASWRRAWQLYDVEMTGWPAFKQSGRLEDLSNGNPTFVPNWRHIFDTMYRGGIDAWGYQWVFTHWNNGAVSCIPAVNMVTNIGFGPDATHTSNPNDARRRLARALPTPLVFPNAVGRRPEIEHIYEKACEPKPKRRTFGRRFRATPIGRAIVRFGKSLRRINLIAADSRTLFRTIP